jgi:DNA repair ATPase RecN
MNLDMDDTDLAKLLTPNTEQMCLQFLHSIPTDSAVTSQQQPSARIATEDQLLSSLGLTENEIENLVSGGQNQNQAEPSDHVYSNKRPLDDDETLSNFDPTTPTTSNSSNLLTPKKKQRTRGIYRAEDVTNEVDLANYLERRVKNNISSKISRANKKSYYMEMDAKSAAIEAENRRLEIKLQKLEKLNQIMKDYLKDAFVGNLK